MIEIKPTKAFNEVFKIYGKKTIFARYQWFLFEFGKRVTRTFLKHLKTEIKSIPGTSDYRKSLLLAEIRDKGKQSWFAIVSSAKGFGDHDPETSIIEVVARFKKPNDPVYAILELMGPWTVDTLPFLPSMRQGQAVVKTASEKNTKAVREKNFKNSQALQSAMTRYGVSYDTREKVRFELKIIQNLEVEALAMEFGMADKAKPHWRPSLRWMKRNIVKFAERDRDLFKVWYEPNFRKYRVMRRLRLKLSQRDLDRIKDFQDKVRN